MTNTSLILELGLGSVAGLATAVSTVVTVGFKGLRASNVELRAAIEFEQSQRERERLECGRALDTEREVRQREHTSHVGEIKRLEGRIQGLTGDAGELIANAVIKTLSISHGNGNGLDLYARVTTLESQQAANQGDGK